MRKDDLVNLTLAGYIEGKSSSGKQQVTQFKEMQVSQKGLIARRHKAVENHNCQICWLDIQCFQVINIMAVVLWLAFENVFYVINKTLTL